MSWFGGSAPNTDLDIKINEATSESIPNGELDLSVALEITDLIRSKRYQPKQCMRSLKKRLTTVYQNPNLLTSTLKLIDLCVKNGGYHFLVELSSKEFVDYLIDYIFKVHYNTKDPETINVLAKRRVGELILSLIKEWKNYFEGQLQLNYVEKCYSQLLNQGYDFPLGEPNLNSKFVDSEAPPDWVDNNECMICYNAFSMINRKHHCRSCGGVFCQTHSSHYSPLVSLGIMEPVRVCDNCYEKIKHKNSGSLNKIRSSKENSNSANGYEEDEELRRAIEISLQESSDPYGNNSKPYVRLETPPVSTSDNIEEDEDMKKAIAASLKEFEEQEKMYKHRESAATPKQVSTQSDFYSNILPFDQPQVKQNAYSNLSQIQNNPPLNDHSMTHSENLTPQEEDQINLFITLISQVKGDASKSANILYNSNLNELHSKVIKLKPKLNKSLRNSIEKYEAFLELNNKISTISRLYDQFLEAKLNIAFGNHTISNVEQPQYEERYQSNAIKSPEIQYANYSLPQHVIYNSQISFDNPKEVNIAHNGLKPQGNFNDTHINSALKYESNLEQKKYLLEGEMTNKDYLNEEVQNPSYYTEEFPYRPSQFSDQESGPPLHNANIGEQAAHPPYYQPSEPEASPYPQYSPQQDSYSSLLQGTSLGPSYPPNEDVEEAKQKFPAIEKIDNEYANNAGDLPTMPEFPQLNVEEEERKEERRSSKFIAEPEPLIEL